MAADSAATIVYAQGSKANVLFFDRKLAGKQPRQIRGLFQHHRNPT
jgi:hypothetical protein